MNVLVATDLEKRYRPVWPGADPAEVPSIHAVRGVSLSLAAGEITVLAGPSGSGKTTLVNLLAGFEGPDAGAVHWPGDTSRPTWSDLAVVPQALGLLDELTLTENVTLPLRLRDGRVGAGARARVEEVLDALGVGHVGGHQPSEASLGEQQRGAIARALVVEPTVLLLDEPTAHQDAAARKWIIDAVATAARAGTAVLAATHDSAVLDIADRRIRMADGRIR